MDEKDLEFDVEKILAELLPEENSTMPPSEETESEDVFPDFTAEIDGEPEEEIPSDVVLPENEKDEFEVVILGDVDTEDEPGIFDFTPTPKTPEISPDDDENYVNSENIDVDYPDNETTVNDDYDEEFEDFDAADFETQPRKSKKTSPKKSKILKIVWHSWSIARVLLVVVISIFLSVKAIGYGSEYLGIERPTKLQLIKISKGDTASEIANVLKEKDIIKTVKMFNITVRLKNAASSFVVGEHYVSANMGYNSIIEELTTPIKRDTVDITFPEGIYLYDAAKLLMEKGVIGKVTAATTAEEKDAIIQNFLEYFNNYSNDYKFEQHLPKEKTAVLYQREGFFFPETYQFYKYLSESDIDVVCAKIYDVFESKFTDSMYKQMTLKKYDLNEVITLASIVQMEAPNFDEMKNVASVFENRLTNPAGIGRSQPYLESDPTKKYITDVIRPNMLPGAERNRIMAGYDTYENSGLPPGAICNPGLEAINAVLFPNTTNYYYFVANINTKVTYYATTLEGHNANIQMVNEQYAAAAAENSD